MGFTFLPATLKVCSSLSLPFRRSGDAIEFIVFVLLVESEGAGVILCFEGVRVAASTARTREGIGEACENSFNVAEAKIKFTIFVFQK
jgi:hypothetical protein